MKAFNSPTPTAALRNFTQRLTQVDFNVNDPEHIKAYICLTQHGRQHPTLRFNLTNGFQDVHSMMNAIVGAEFIKQFPDLRTSANELVTSAKNAKVA
jgi:hypothetical protein